MNNNNLNNTNDLILNVALNGTQQSDETDDIDDIEQIEAFVPDEILAARRISSKPNISWLKSAVETSSEGSKFLPVKGGYLVMERKNMLLSTKPWLDTKVYRLLSNPDSLGNVRLLDCSEQHQASLNWHTALQYGYDLRLPPPGRNPELLFESGTKRRRKHRLIETAIATDNETTNIQQHSPTQNEPKRKRGRPKGSKNRK